MSDRTQTLFWIQTARRLAAEFDQRLGSHADEFIAFEAPGRAIAIGITLPTALLRPEDAPRFGWVPPAAKSEPLELAADEAVSQARAFKEFVTIERTILLGGAPCLNLVQLLRRPTGETYAVHGISSCASETELRTDMAAVVARIAAD